MKVAECIHFSNTCANLEIVKIVFMNRYCSALLVLLMHFHFAYAQWPSVKTDLKGHPKSMVEKEWFVIPDQLDTVLVSTAIYEYDELGRVLSHAFFSMDLFGFRQENQFQEDDWVFSKSFDSDDKAATEHFAYWGKPGMIDSVIVINHNEGSRFTEVFIYDASDRLMLRNRYDKDRNLVLQAKYNYTSREKFPMVEATFNKDGKLIYEHFFDENGMKILSNVFLEGKLYSKEEYFYENEKMVHFVSENEFGEKQIEMFFSFDMQGLLIKEESKMLNMDPLIKTYFYENDTVGNWIKRESRSALNHTFSVREISYFPSK